MWGGLGVSAVSASCHPPSPPHHHHQAWLLNWLIQSCRWSDLALLRCETISSGPPRPPTATGLTRPDRCCSRAHPRDHIRVVVGSQRLLLFPPLSFSGSDSLSAGPSAANYIKFPAQSRRRKFAAGAVY